VEVEIDDRGHLSWPMWRFDGVEGGGLSMPRSYIDLITEPIPEDPGKVWRTECPECGDEDTADSESVRYCGNCAGDRGVDVSLRKTPIPEEPEGPNILDQREWGGYEVYTNPTPPVDPVEEAWDRVPPVGGSRGASASTIVAQAPLREQFDELCTLHARLGGRVVGLEKRIEALEANVAHHEQSVWAQAEVVARLDEQIIDLRSRGTTRAVRTVRNPNPKEVMPDDGNGPDPRPVTPPPVAEKDAAGGEGGSRHQGPRWHQLDIGGILTARVYGQSDEEIAERVALLEGAFREGQRDTRAVLTDEMVEAAFTKYYEDLPGNPRHCMRRALLSTGLVREASDGE
jgi:hypothetical protein